MFTGLNPSDITLLRVFRSVCECGGIAAAAERHGSAASTISTQIITLEKRLGLKLCSRGRSGFSITAEGERVLKYANQVFDANQAFVHNVSKLKNSLAGELRIGILDNIISNPLFNLGALLLRYQQHNPNVNLTIEICVPELLEQAVLDRRYDIGIGVKQHQIPNLVYHFAFDETEVVCCGRNHDLYDVPSSKLDTDRLRDSNWVLDFYRLPSKFPETNPPFRTTYVTSVEAGLHLVLSGSYLGILPTHYIAPWHARQDIKVLLENELSYSLDFSVIYNVNRKHNAIISRFLSLITTHPGRC